ncbi:MAG: hypothetical protein R3F48_09855 [Candidatus Zixiibacteriota bacterium]
MKKTIATSLVVVLAVFGAWHFLLHKPGHVQMEDLKRQIQTQEKKLAAYNIALSSIQAKMKEYDSTCAELGLDDIAYSGEDEVISLYRTMDSLCHRTGYELEEITPSLDEVIQFLRRWESAEARVYIPINIKIKGDYKKLTSLVEDIESHAYFDHLDNTKLTGNDELYPDCRLDIAFVAGLNNRMGMLDSE